MLLHENISLLFPATVPCESPATICLNLVAVGLAVALATEHLQMGIQASLESREPRKVCAKPSLAHICSQVLDSVPKRCLQQVSDARQGGFCYSPFHE